MADKNKPPFYLIDTQSAFYKPFGVRLAICVSVTIWAGLESWHRDPFWSVISIAAAAYCIYVLFWTYKAPVDPMPRQPDVDEDEDQADSFPVSQAELPAEDEKPKS